MSGGRLVPGKNANSATADLSYAKVHSLLVSDSIIVRSEDSSVEGLLSVILAVKEMLNYGIIYGVPLRGGLSCGELSFYDNSQGDKYAQNSLIGQGLVNAYEVAHVNGIDFYGFNNEGLREYGKSYLVDYSCLMMQKDSNLSYSDVGSFDNSGKK